MSTKLEDIYVLQCVITALRIEPEFVGGGNWRNKNNHKSYSTLEPFMSYGTK